MRMRTLSGLFLTASILVCLSGCNKRNQQVYQPVSQQPTVYNSPMQQPSTNSQLPPGYYADNHGRIHGPNGQFVKNPNFAQRHSKLVGFGAGLGTYAALKHSAANTKANGGN